MVNNERTTAFTIAVGALAFLILLAPFSLSQAPVNEVKGTPAGWSNEINLSNTPKWDNLCDIDSNGSDVYVVWRHMYKGSTPNVDHQIVYTKSLDGGQTWSEFQNVSNEKAVHSNPEISVFKENIHVVWDRWNEGEGVNRVFYRKSNDGGNSWDMQKQISEETGYPAGGPKIFSNDSNIHIIWKDMRGSDEEIYYRRSLDGGISFDNGQGVNEDRRLTFSPGPIGDQEIFGYESNVSIVWPE